LGRIKEAWSLRSDYGSPKSNERMIYCPVLPPNYLTGSMTKPSFVFVARTKALLLILPVASQ